ncbi:hypothetical protein TanjilG_18295 [Lupinus angustifolius]|uniref:Uncharacterized protein n=1 Tax=Lupinus angustifolius TaxID=3871 RepID=A0A1J7H1S8_LUPAN|nr:hypothetical protein TanjilG_18295 [Lupinus angustifolius]
MEVDIMSWTNKGDLAANKDEDLDATENSSSFADTTSDTENCSRLSDIEVESVHSDQYRSKANKRRKRKKVEDTTDVASYASHHNIFSDLENKKSDPDGCLAYDSNNPVITEVHADSTHRFGINDDDQSFFEFDNADASLEQLLREIDNVHAKVHKLKNQVDKVMSKNASKFPSSKNLSLLLPHGDVSSAHSPIMSAGNGDAVSVGAIYNSNHHVAEFDLGDFVMPDSAVSSYGEVTIVPDVIESTVGLLFAADVTVHHPLAGNLCEDIVDNILIHEVAETEEHIFTNFNVAAANSAAASQDEPTLKSCLYKDANVPRNKRKRGERKAGSGAWSKKCSGEPDSQ